MHNIKTQFYNLYKHFPHVVIWGLRYQRSTFRYIHHYLYSTLKKMDVPVLWVEDSPLNQKCIKKGDLVISVNIAGKHLPVIDNTYYCLHNFDQKFHKQIKSKYQLTLQVYIKGVESKTEKWDEVTYFERNKRILFQPWATNLLPWEFYEPIHPTLSPFVFWVGSVWNNPENQGNIKEINNLKKVLKKNKLKFIHIQNVPDFVNMKVIRLSRIAPAIGGAWQAKNNYLPCRMWKNISYGQLGISNIPKFQKVFANCHIKSLDIEKSIEEVLSLSKNKYISIVKEQQDIVKRQHTYLNRLISIAQTF